MEFFIGWKHHNWTVNTTVGIIKLDVHYKKTSTAESNPILAIIRPLETTIGSEEDSDMVIIVVKVFSLLWMAIC